MNDCKTWYLLVQMGEYNKCRVFFKVVRPISQCLHPPLFSFMRSWVINIKWRVFNSLYCGHNWNLLFSSLLGTGLNESHSSEVFLWEGIFLSFSAQEKSLSLYLLLLFIWEEATFFFIFLPCLTMVLPVTLCFCDGFYLPYFVLSLLWNEPSYFWHWFDQCWYHCCNVFSLDIIWAEDIIHLTRLTDPFLRTTSCLSEGPSLTAS